MRKGFAYPAVLFLLAAALSAAVFFTFAAARWRGIIRLDMQAVQARQMAENALVYIDTHSPVLPANNLNVSALDRDALLALDGYDYRDENLGFRIVRNKEVIYLIGYAGGLPEPKAVYILYRKGDKFKPWYG